MSGLRQTHHYVQRRINFGRETVIYLAHENVRIIASGTSDSHSGDSYSIMSVLTLIEKPCILHQLQVLIGSDVENILENTCFYFLMSVSLHRIQRLVQKFLTIFTKISYNRE